MTLTSIPLPAVETFAQPAGDMDTQSFLHCNIYQIKDGKTVSLRSCYDATTVLRQLGLVPATT